MRRLLIISATWLTMAFSAHALSVELPVTPETLDQSNYRFSVTANPTKTETDFHVTITSKIEDIAADSNAGLEIVTHTKNRDGSTSGTSIVGFKPEIAITLKKEKRVWTADFTIPRKSLKTDGLCFIFTELAHDTINGQRITMPSATFYEIKLKDFVKE